MARVALAASIRRPKSTVSTIQRNSNDFAFHAASGVFRD